MRTELIPEQAFAVAWLEHFPAKGGPPQRTPLDKSPFVIGRSDSADLQVSSSRVSREHAVLVQEGRECRVRDLDSTNGTLLNGRRIKEAVLQEGDLLVIANVEFTFCCGRPGGNQRTVTQLMTEDPESGEDSLDPARSMLSEVRRWRETLLSGCVSSRLEPLVELSSGRVFGYEAGGESDAPALAGLAVLSPAVPRRTARRLGHLRRLCAVEQAALLPGARVLVRIEPSEIAAEGLAGTVGSLCNRLAASERLIVGMPYDGASAAAQADAVVGPLRERGVAVALDGFTGRTGHLAPSSQTRPDYVRLASALVRNIQRSTEHQRLVEAAVRAAYDGGWEVIAAGIRSQEERTWCQELGCTLGQGPWFSEPPRREAPDT